MIECLCLITLISAILLVAIAHYRSQRDENTRALVKSDVQLLSVVLRDYVQQKGCYGGLDENRGYFSGETQPKKEDLEQTVSLPESRLPLIQRYEYAVEDHLNTETKGPRVYHRLIIKGVLGDQYSQHADGLAALLGATLGQESDPTLEWFVPMLEADGVRSASERFAFLKRMQTEDSDAQVPSFASCWLEEAA